MGGCGVHTLFPPLPRHVKGVGQWEGERGDGEGTGEAAMRGEGRAGTPVRRDHEKRARVAMRGEGRS